MQAFHIHFEKEQPLFTLFIHESPRTLPHQPGTVMRLKRCVYFGPTYGIGLFAPGVNVHHVSLMHLNYSCIVPFLFLESDSWVHFYLVCLCFLFVMMRRCLCASSQVTPESWFAWTIDRKTDGVTFQDFWSFRSPWGNGTITQPLSWLISFRVIFSPALPTADSSFYPACFHLAIQCSKCRSFNIYILLWISLI